MHVMLLKCTMNGFTYVALTVISKEQKDSYDNIPFRT